MKSMFLIASLSVLTSTACGQNSDTIAHEDEYRSTIWMEADADDYDAPTDRKYVALPPEVIPLMLRMLQESSKPQEKGSQEERWAFRMRDCLVAMLTNKLEQYRAIVAPATRQAVIDAIVAQLEHEHGENLRLLLVSSERLKDPKVDQFLMRLKQSNDAETQKLAVFFIEDRTKQ